MSWNGGKHWQDLKSNRKYKSLLNYIGDFFCIKLERTLLYILTKKVSAVNIQVLLYSKRALCTVQWYKYVVHSITKQCITKQCTKNSTDGLKLP